MEPHPTGQPWLKLLGRIVLAAICGFIFALVPTSVLLYLVFAARGYTRESLVELPAPVLCLIGAIGALIAVPVFLGVGHIVVPRWLKGAALGSLSGGVVALISTLSAAFVIGGPIPKAQAPYMEAGLRYAVPIALAIGGVCGAIMSKRLDNSLGTEK